ncbi:capsule biosynthesis GfcC family protein [Pantoea anthophila]|uniref:capsule biosynthesis GfcC family protein n=1 Tax=Pantoea anthophila TaxID=470931 RepID=UPI002DC05C0A|nr:capsule biosynthesis GfcC family protein [Pantoea anthophila]MEB6223997.1 capsule biosynthesis GfcC family protein [Pantoea anthophila]
MKKITFLLAGLSLLSTAGAQATAQVIVHAPHNGGQAELSQIVDLAQLVTLPPLQANTDWRRTFIAERGASAVAQQHYQQTLGELRAWRADSSGDRAAAIDEVIRQLSAIRVTGRQFTSLDPDWVRLHPADNRRLEGSYDLWLQTPSDSVLLLGALSGAGKVSWQPGKSVCDYLEGHSLLSGAERNFVTVIAPSGATQQVPVAYWNHRHVEVEPGSIIWLGFSSWSLPGAYEDLNDRLLSVLTHRIPD